MKHTLSLLALSTLVFACTPQGQAAPPQIVNVYASPATQPWLSELYACAEGTSAVLNISPDSPEISLRLGEPQGLSTPAYQIGIDDVLVVVNRQSPLAQLDAAGVRALFAGAGDPSLQVWVYAAGEDVQEIFEQFVMDGRRVSASARLALSPQAMSDLLNADANAVGILPRRWPAGDTREVCAIPSVPVLAIALLEPQGALREILACVQN